MTGNGTPNGPVSRILDWLRAGYPSGIPKTDYVPLLEVLHRNLTEEEIAQSADLLAAESTGEPITADDIRAMVREHVYEQCSDEDLIRVSVRLAAAGWPLASDVAKVAGS
ncbi:DUF3349 domain-containing protein [Nocardioides sp. KR10-350]|uniref:DUF3349 domain-containing protein n=1 Tax=Nocardioides cheoyonin TaxID=3156615 RepID=UPI0032B598B2